MAGLGVSWMRLTRRRFLELSARARDLNDIDEAIVPNTFISCSHLYNWSRALTEVLGPNGRA